MIEWLLLIGFIIGISMMIGGILAMTTETQELERLKRYRESLEPKQPKENSFEALSAFWDKIE